MAELFNDIKELQDNFDLSKIENKDLRKKRRYTMKNEVKEKPIIFSTPMVQAILDGKKTQTRRVIKPQPESIIRHNDGSYSDLDRYITKRPRYDVGDILWVRETWTKDVEGFIYKAGLEDWQLKRFDSWNYKWKPSIFMPHEAARIFLQVKSFRVERLQDISEKDAKAEGVESLEKYITLWDTIHNRAEVHGIEKIKASGYSWEINPWVFVYEFMRVEKEVING